MKIKILGSSAIIVALLFLSSYTLYNEEGDKNGLLLKLMIKGMEYYHYQPQDIDDSFSETVFTEYLKRLDYGKRFLTERDVENLRKYQHLIDDEINDGSYEMFDLSIGILNRRVSQAESYYKEILAEPFDFDKKESLDMDIDNMAFASSEAEIKERWRKFLKYQTMTRLATKIERQEKAKKEGDEEFEIKSFALLEEEAREAVVKAQDSYFKRLSRMDDNDRRADYLNSIANIYDPHTGYFPPKDKENFDIQMSGRLEGIGAQLRETEGYIKVVRIVPGSASAKQGQLEVNDLIIKVGQADDDPVDVVDMDIDDAIKMIRGKKGTEVRLTVKKIDGNEVEIPIVRDIVKLEDTYAKSVILNHGKSKKGIGYIHLPKFYADFKDKNGPRCSRDVAKEVQKLKDENVKGIILDLRNNGGGSLQDVVDMVGLFIEKGPVVQVKSRERNPRILSDRNPKIQYDGPLVILVNSLSASASEIMAAAIQDYKRGVIVGSSSTFGKGTVQLFIPLNDFNRSLSGEESLGEIKMTTQKFYRINGGATQLKGVIPDIILPDQYSKLDIGEKDQDFPMKWDEIAPVAYDEWADQPDIEALKEQSEERVNDNPVFQLVKENAQRLKTRQDQNQYSLNLEAYRAEKTRLEAEADKYKEISKEIEDLNIQTPTADIAYIESDETRKDRIDEWHKRIKKDAYINEALFIIKDMK